LATLPTFHTVTQDRPGPALGRIQVPGQDRPHGHVHRLVLGLTFLLGCTPPQLRQAQPAEIHTDRLAFLADGKTTREEVLLALGTPNARLEAERVLTYACFRTTGGEWWMLGGRYPGGVERRFVYKGRNICSLVLVFGADGRLARHSLVVSE